MTSPSSGDGTRSDLKPITPRQAMGEWLDIIDSDTSGSTSDSYKRRVSQFIDWCESEGIMNLNDVDGRDLKAYRDHREPALNSTSMKNELRTVRQFLEYGVALEAVEPALAEKFTQHIPSLTKGEVSSDLTISRERVHTILDHLDKFRYATRDHALFITMWDTGARISGLRALDVGDFDVEDGTVRFVSREESGTRLKNGVSGERLNVLNEKTVTVLRDYIREHRMDREDDYGRSPLFTTKFGRPTTSTVRQTAYLLTQPCFHSGCPHDEEPASCPYRKHGHESKCPSSLSPHPIRTGRITDLRNRDVRITKVAARVDAMPDTIRAYYDKPNLGEELDRRRDEISAAGL
ncbi:tyrosine-type recombinase/integrase [Halobaculum sp. P14]|uniref:tyrosine-type recombinase/integrase n=1 Tax=Halobaculum sp. P14 TaxID=3421638 RepID=UPI003EBA182D